MTSGRSTGWLENFRRAFFLVAQPQQIRQKPYRIPPNRGAPEQAQLGFLAAALQKHLQGSLERDIAEIGQPDAPPRASDQLLGAWRPAQAGQRG